MLVLTKWLLLSLYGLAPVIAVAYARWPRRSVDQSDGQPRSKATVHLTSAAVVALAVGVGLNIAYAYFAGAVVQFWQIALTCYFMLALILLLRGFNRVLQIAVERLFRLDLTSRKLWHTRAFAAGVIRAVLLFGLGLPMVMASVMTYRPKVKLAENPQQQLGVHFEDVYFSTRDGIPISGWWIPAIDRFGRPASNVTETVLVCHGLGANKSNQLTLGAHFVQAGFNVLIFDFRAHGHSGGQVSSFGDFERFDVLAAVHWLKTERPQQAKKIYGVGASMGAAALIAAAADHSEDGLAIDAVAAYGTYDSIGNWAKDIAKSRFSVMPPLDWLMLHVSLPMASAHAGTDLAAFSPAALIDHVAPRPVMIIHGQYLSPERPGDQIIAFERGEALNDAASQPKFHYWVPGGDHNGIINDQTIGRIVAEFFRTAPQAL